MAKQKSTGMVGVALITVVSVAIGGAILAAGYPLVHRLVVQFQHADEAKDFLPQQVTCAGDTSHAAQVIGCGGVAPTHGTKRSSQEAHQRQPSPPREGVQMPDSLQD